MGYGKDKLATAVKIMKRSLETIERQKKNLEKPDGPRNKHDWAKGKINAEMERIRKLSENNSQD